MVESAACASHHGNANKLHFYWTTELINIYIFLSFFLSVTLRSQHNLGKNIFSNNACIISHYFLFLQIIIYICSNDENLNKLCVCVCVCVCVCSFNIYSYNEIYTYTSIK